jgi:NADH:ubiquinone oxidoreductase subunit F (NADH-binding)/ferredoxin
MDRRVAANNDLVQFRIDATRCDGQGVCVLIAPEIFELDRYDLAYVTKAADALVRSDEDVRSRGFEADAMCPRDAIFEMLASARPAPVERPEAEPADVFVPRFVLPELGEGTESLDDWRTAGGFKPQEPMELLQLIEQSGLTGHGGAGFPTAEKWKRMMGADQPVVVANGSEREPGTHKDRWLMTHRPALVLDGVVLAARAVGAALAIIGIDDESEESKSAVSAAIDDATAQGLLDGLEIRLQGVPNRYVAGEETALLNVIEGNAPIPRLRPPFPSDVGVFGRATLVQNVETLAQLAVATVLGPDSYRSAGTHDVPGSGVFTVGPFGGPYTVVEKEFGHSLKDLLAEHHLLDGLQAVLVGGYAGGLLQPDALDVPLTPAALRGANASLGTKSIQVIGAGQCPVRVIADIVGYFGEQSADQCPMCSQGLPDMAGIMRGLEDGTAGQSELDELAVFMDTLPNRGVCRLPDGAARVTVSLLTNFAELVAAHVGAGCPTPQS